MRIPSFQLNFQWFVFLLFLGSASLWAPAAQAQTSNYCDGPGTNHTVNIGSYNVITNYWSGSCSGTQCVTINDSTGAFGVTEYTGTVPTSAAIPRFITAAITATAVPEPTYPCWSATSPASPPAGTSRPLPPASMTSPMTSGFPRPPTPAGATRAGRS